MEKKNFYKKILIISSNFYPEISKNLQKGVLNVLNSEKIEFELKFISGEKEIFETFKIFKRDSSFFFLLDRFKFLQSESCMNKIS